MKLSIVIPCYNEQQRIGMLFAALKNFASKFPHDYEIIIIDDGSTDDVVATIRNNDFLQEQEKLGKFTLYSLEQNQGKGNALRKGVELATGTHILTMDADLSYDPMLVMEWLKIKKEFADDEILLGSRLHKASENIWEGEQPANKSFRKLAGYIFSGITKVLTTIKVSDNQSGFKLYPAALARYLFANMKIKGWAHDVELLYRADLNRFRITEMPVKCINREGSKISLAKDAFNMLGQTVMLGIRMRWNYYIAEPLKLLFSKNDALLPPVPDSAQYKRESIFRLLFVTAALLMFIIMPAISGKYGLSGDEWIQNQYGHEIYNYFENGDSTAYSEIGRSQNYDAIIYYSGGYELLLVKISKCFPQVFEYDVRHFVNAIVGCLLFLFTGLFAKRLGGWRVGFIALLFVWLSPRLFGESINNSKDIPFAFGMIFTLYHFIPFLKALPRPSWRSVILITLGIAITLNIRIGGLMLYAYLGLFTAIIYLWKLYNKEISGLFGSNLWRLAGMGAVIVVVSYALGICTWPWALQEPLSNPLLSMEKMTKFPVTVRVLFNGEMINSGMPPWNYTLLWILRTSPEIVVLLFAAFVVLVFRLARYYKTAFVHFLLFVTVFPVAYAVYKGSGLYDGWRHFLFIYPTMVIGAALMAGFIFDVARSKMVKTSFALVLAAGLFLPVRKLFVLHPNQYVYFNDMSGGLAGNYKVFETDYYMNSARECFFTLAEKENFAAARDTILLITNMVKEVNEYAKTVSPYIKVIYSKFEARTDKDYDYGIFMSRFVDYDLLKADGWPAKDRLVTIERDGVPLSFAIKKKHDGDYLGTRAMEAQDFATAIREFEAYLRTDETNEAVLVKLGQCYLNTGAFPKAADVLEKAVAYYPIDNNKMMLGMAYAQSNRLKEAVDVLSAGARHNKEMFEKYRDIYLEDNENIMAGNNMQYAAQMLGGYYYYLSMCYQQMGDMNQAQSYMNEAVRFNPKLGGR